MKTAQVQKDFLVNHIVDRLTEYLVVDHALELADALKIVYQSKTYQRLQDVDASQFLAEIENLPTQEERKRERARIDAEVNYFLAEIEKMKKK